MSCSGQKRPFGNFPGSVRPLLYPMEPGRQPTVPRETRLRVEAALALSLVDLFDDRPFARFNHIGSLVALDVAILTQPRGFPIDGFGEGSDLHGLRQALPDPDPASRGAACRWCGVLSGKNERVCGSRDPCQNQSAREPVVPEVVSLDT